MIELNHIHLSYKNKDLINEGKISGKRNEIILIKGKSGCGKTTLLYEMSLLRKTSCQYFYDGKRIDLLSHKQKAEIRKNKIGFVMQECLLMEQLTVYENIVEYTKLNGISLSKQDINELLDHLNIGSLKNKKVGTLSGGEKQRVAITCMISKKPELLLLDEPTSQLDEKNEKLLMEWIVNAAKTYHICVVMTSHKQLDNYANKVYSIENQELRLIRESYKQNDTQRYTVQRSPQRFYNYLQFQIRKDHLYYIKLCLVILVIPFVITGLSMILSSYTNSQTKVIQENSQKLIFNEEYIIQTVKIDNTFEADLLFYYPQNQINKYIKQEYNKTGCYVSQHLFQSLHRNLKESTLSYSYQDKIYEVPVAGLLHDTKVINNTYNDNYILIPIDDYIKVTGNNPAYSVDSIQELLNYEESEIVFVEDIELCQSYITNQQFYQKMLYIIQFIFIITSLFISYMWCHYRRKSWAYDYIDGYSLGKIFQYACKEYLGMMLIIGLCLLVNLNGISLLFIKHMTVFIIVLLIISYLFIKNMDFQKIMRS